MYLYLALAGFWVIAAAIVFIGGQHPAVGALFLVLAIYNVARWWAKYSYVRTIRNVPPQPRGIPRSPQDASEPDPRFDFTRSPSDEEANKADRP